MKLLKENDSYAFNRYISNHITLKQKMQNNILISRIISNKVNFLTKTVIIFNIYLIKPRFARIIKDA